MYEESYIIIAIVCVLAISVLTLVMMLYIEKIKKNSDMLYEMQYDQLKLLQKELVEIKEEIKKK